MRVSFLAGASAGGLVVGALLFCLSLTPSMVPRSPVLQGALGGLAFSIGYAFWIATCRIGRWLEIGALPPTISRYGTALVTGLAVCTVGVCLWRSATWQNSIRRTWGLEDAATAAPMTITLVAVLVFLGLLLFGRAFVFLARRWRRRSARLLPGRLSFLFGFLVATLLVGAFIDGLAVRSALRAVDQASQLADQMIAPELAAPTDPLKSGSPASAVGWTELGRWGRAYVASGPSGEDISEFWSGPALEPIRVYVGLNAAATPEARARLAFEELERVGGFDRSVLVIAMPTGSGWLDPGAVDSLEFISRGDVATVAVQYSYLPSPVSVIVDPTHGIEEAQRLFDLVYRRWTNLPRDRRPKLYLHGLSLGAYLSQETVPLLDVFSDPFDGALWAGSPFLSEFWRMVVDRRQTGSPAWRPRFGNGSLVRTMNQYGGLAAHDSEWGPIRLVLLQYGSDPIVFFDWSLAWRKPDWLAEDRAPDLSPMMRWVPLVTMLQVGVDMTVALGALGYGHDYTVRHYIPAWAEALGPAYWDADTEARLIEHLRDLVPR